MFMATEKETVIPSGNMKSAHRARCSAAAK